MSHKYLMKTHGIKVVVFWEGYKFEKKNISLLVLKFTYSVMSKGSEKFFLTFFLAFSIKLSLN